MQAAVRLTRRQAGVDPRRLLELGAALRRAGPPRVAAAVGLGHPGRGRRRRATPTRRSCWPTAPRARAWTARRSRCPATRTQLIDAVAAVNRRTIVVLNTGGPVLMPWLHHVEAVLAGLVPGPAVRRRARLRAVRRQRSRRPAAGHLPGRATTQGPAPPTRPERYPGVNGEQRYDEGHLRRLPLVRPVPPAAAVPVRLRAVLRATSASATCACCADHGGVTATTRVTNTSRRAGSTVAQAYLSFPRSAGEPPRQLKGYEKVQLGAGPQRGRHVPPRPRRPGLLRRGARHRQVVADGRYTLSVGSSSRDLPESASFELGRHGHR